MFQKLQEIFMLHARPNNYTLFHRRNDVGIQLQNTKRIGGDMFREERIMD
jgi:hypothetical protein